MGSTLNHYHIVFVTQSLLWGEPIDLFSFFECDDIRVVVGDQSM